MRQHEAVPVPPASNLDGGTGSQCDERVSGWDEEVEQIGVSGTIGVVWVPQVVNRVDERLAVPLEGDQDLPHVVPAQCVEPEMHVEDVELVMVLVDPPR